MDGLENRPDYCKLKQGTCIHRLNMGSNDCVECRTVKIISALELATKTNKRNMVALNEVLNR